MPNKSIPAAAEGMPTSREVSTDANRRHPLEFETESLPLDQLRILSEALTTIANVISGLREWPAFSKADYYTAAGKMLQELQDKVGWEIAAIRAIADERKVASPEEAEAKFEIVSAGMIWIGERPETVATKLAALSAELNSGLNRDEGASA